MSALFLAISIISNLERVGDHLVNIGYSIQNPTGNQPLALKITND